MTNLNSMTTDRLLYLADWIKNRKKLTQRGQDIANQNLVEIDAELESRRPVGEFRVLYQEMNTKTKRPIFSSFLVPIGFEYLGPTCSCGRAQKDCTFPYCEA